MAAEWRREPDSEVEALLLRGEIGKALEIIALEMEYECEVGCPPCEGCGKLIGHASWCPLRYWR
jgi:hypothetical protein